MSEVFRYEAFRLDAVTGTLTCEYSVSGRSFSEVVTLAPGPAWETPQARAAARWVFLLAGVSYYKTAAPPLVDLGDHPVTGAELAFLRQFYLDGLGEFAYRNNLDLSALQFRTPSPAPGPAPGPAPIGADGSSGPSSVAAESPATGELAPMGQRPRGGVAPVGQRPRGGVAPVGQRPREGVAPVGQQPRVLVPFGGGIDSIVTVEMVRPRADAALFVMSRPGDLFDAIEKPAAVTGLPVVRAGRQIDPQLMRSRELGFLNGHVPVTGILSAIALLAAVLDDRQAVVMSNEWSASIPTLEYRGRPVNHQYSKSAEFEAAFREVLGDGLPDYFSALRDRTELWVGEKFAALRGYHASFRSCNRAFHLEKARRLDHWCGECDKCCFIDLILSPFMPAAELRMVFNGNEPLDNPELKPKFDALLGSGTKPFECVGEVTECRAAVLLAARRADRAGTGLLRELAGELAARPDAPGPDEIERMRVPVGDSFVPAWLR